MTSADDSPIPDYLAGLRLDGRPFLLLGAGQGIGRQTAHALHQAGASVACVDRDPDLASEIAEEVSGTPIAADITRREDVQRCIDEATAAYGGIAGIIDIVGVSSFSNITDITDEAWASTFDICLRHVFLAIQLGGPAVARRGGGSLTFVASISGLTSAPQHGAYGAAKAALMSLVRTAATELGPSGVRVNAVAPGGVLTPRWAPSFQGEEKRRIEAIVPLGKLAVPADVANALLFLAGDMASHVSGQVLTVDGGGHIQFPYGNNDHLTDR